MSKVIRRLVALAVVAAGALVPTDDARPNIVYVLLDDASAKVFDYMPETQTLIVDQGVTVRDYIFNQALCCPSRSTMLRGQYAHNTGVRSNVEPDGGYGAFYNNGLEASTVATWLDDAGYATAYIGKYLNGYPARADQGPAHVPAGWDHWFGLSGFGGKSAYDYTIVDDGTLREYGSAPSDYFGDVLAGEALDWLSSPAANDPFMLWVTPSAPHGPSIPAPRHEGMFLDETYPRAPPFNELDVSDKPVEIRNLPLLTDADKADIDKDWRNRLRSVQHVDEMIADIVALLQQQGKLDNTYIVVGSDNGFKMGEHRARGKDTPYEQDVRVPLLVRGPGIPPGSIERKQVGNADLAPTFAEIASADLPSFVDGRSALSLLHGEDVSWRTAYPLSRGGTGVDYTGVRTGRYTYIEYANGEREFYDRDVDPKQEVNSYESMDPALRADLHDLTVGLEGCAGATCRAAENRRPLD